MKRVLTCMITICLFVSGLVLMPGKTARADTRQEDVRLTGTSITIVKNQYAFVGLLGADSKDSAKWSVDGDNIKIQKDGGADGYCYVKAVKPGKGALKCTVNKKTLTCQVKVVSSAAFVGDFCDDAGEVYLDVFKSGKQYVAFYGQFRLCTMEWLRGTVKNGILTLKGKDPAGKPITLTLSRDGKKRILTFKKTTWEYFEQGSTIELKKCSGKKGYEQALAVAEDTYESYF